MRIAAAVLTASAIALAVTGCSSTDDTSGSSATTTANLLDGASSAVNDAAGAAQGAISSAQGAVTSARSAAGGAIDTAKVTSFTVAFKAAVPQLAEGRDDAAIQDIYSQTCAAITAGTAEAAVVASLEVSAANNGTNATQEQAQRIYNIAKPLC